MNKTDKRDKKIMVPRDIASVKFSTVNRLKLLKKLLKGKDDR